MANIGALFSTIKFFFSMLFSFYSKNFDNFKLIEKIFNYSKNKTNINVLNIDSNISAKSKQQEDNIDIMNNINNLDPLIDEKLSENNLDKKDPSINKVDNEENKVEDEKSVFVLNKLRFYDFFFNNLYSTCCKKIKNQEIINKINEITFKYLSVDSLFYNQIKLECLMEDYKWNNPLLSVNQYKKIISKLKID